MKAYFVCNHCGEVIDVKDLNQEVECPRCYREVNVENASDYGERDEQAAKGWPGDGSGLDDFQDANANEADDYRDE